MSEPTTEAGATKALARTLHASEHAVDPFRRDVCPSCWIEAEHLSAPIARLAAAGWRLIRQSYLDALRQENERLTEALSVERIADALFAMHAGPTVVEERNGRPIWEGFGWSRGPAPTDVNPPGMWGPELRWAFARALLAILAATPAGSEGESDATR